MRTSRIEGLGFAVLLASLCATIFVAGPGAVASEIEHVPASGSMAEMPMSVIGFDDAVAAENGYELRTAPSGDRVSVPMSNAPGDFSGSRGSMLTTQGITVPGDCGNSWIYFQNGNTQIRTGYVIKSSRGQAFSHTWSATVATLGMGGATGSYPMSGLAPLHSASWQAIRTIVQPYTSKASALAGGTAVTTAGWICSSGDPTAKYPER